MTTQTAGTSVRASVVVETPIAHAFKVFTEQMDTWWPPDHHVLEGELIGMVFEPRVGGHIYDRGANGTESRWARVLAYDPPNRVVFSWDISMQWQIETDPDRTSEVDVTFIAEGPRRTRVELEHRKLDNHGDGWASMRDAVGDSDGWQKGLDAFAKAAAA
jgi:uncharacterized protein YndB with AHSA1/START domain